MGRGKVIAVATDDQHQFSKRLVKGIRVVTGLGVEGDAHEGVTVKHRSRVRADPTQPNLRQVHLIQAELLDELADKGFDVAPADLSENVTTRGVDLLALPRGAVLRLGADVELQVTRTSQSLLPDRKVSIGSPEGGSGQNSDRGDR
jgi:MOSC domain-containing protein YiiM